MPFDPEKLAPNTPEKKAEKPPKRSARAAFSLFNNSKSNLFIISTDEENREMVEADPQKHGYRKLAGAPWRNK